MPPRRRKRNVSATRLRPLTFEESPVNIVHDIPSPAYASDHPATADVITLDGTVPGSWVSPQFVGDPTPNHRLRRRRKRSGLDETRTNRPTTRSRHNNDQRGDITQQQREAHLHKFEPLNFVGQLVNSSPEIDLAADDISVTNQEYVSNDSAHRLPNPEHTKASHTEVIGNDDIPPERITPSEKQNVVTDNFTNVSGCNFDTPQQHEQDDNSSVTSVTVKLKDMSNQYLKGSTETNLRSYKKTSSKRLFHNRSYQRDFSDSNSYESSSAFDTVPSRRSMRTHNLKEQFFPNSQLACTPDSQKSILNTVLVYDTPEEDYGVSVRERRKRENRIFLK